MCWRLFIAMNLNDTDFELFAVPATFAQDRAALDARWKELQREAHPDRFAARGAAAQRVAMQWSVRINEAYQRLKNPIKRATYLCELNGAPINAENNTAMPSDFLMQQMQWREELEDLQDEADVAGVVVFKRRLKAAQDELNESFAACWDDAAQREQAERLMRRMQFLDKLTYEVRQLEERLDD